MDSDGPFFMFNHEKCSGHENLAFQDKNFEGHGSLAYHLLHVDNLIFQGLFAAVHI